MTERLKEQISAFIDDELPEQEARLLLERLRQDDALRDTYGCYHVIGAALREPQLAPPGLVARVRAAIAAEPGIRAGERRARPAARLLRPAAMVAVAGSVAVFAILGLQNLRQMSPEQAVLPGPAAQAVVSEDLFETVPRPPPATRGLSRGQLARYMVSHGRYATAPGTPGIMSYRTVGADPRTGTEPPPDDGSN